MPRYGNRVVFEMMRSLKEARRQAATKDRELAQLKRRVAVNCRSYG